MVIPLTTVAFASVGGEVAFSDALASLALMIVFLTDFMTLLFWLWQEIPRMMLIVQPQSIIRTLKLQIGENMFDHFFIVIGTV